MENGGLDGLRLLVVEDDILIADGLCETLAAMGAITIGPFSSVEQALEATLRPDLDGAVLDVGLCGKAVYPVADNLHARDLPFLFVTGHDACVFPERYRKVPQLRKPFRPEKLKRLASTVFSPVKER